MDIYTLIKSRHPNLNDKTLQVYTKRITKLLKQLPFDTLTNSPDKVEQFISTLNKSLATKRAYIESIISLIPTGNTDIINKYKEIRHKYYTQIYEQSKDIQEYQPIKEPIISLIKSIQPVDYQSFHEYILLLLLFSFEFKELKDNIGEICIKRYKKDPDTPLCYNVQNSTINNILLPKYLNDQFRQWTKINPTNYLLYHSHTKEPLKNYRNFYNIMKKKYSVLNDIKLSKNRGIINFNDLIA
jgi:hypothetical protein